MPHGTPHHRGDNIKLQKLMNNPAMAETWQTAFGKDFGDMSQGDNEIIIESKKVGIILN